MSGGRFRGIRNGATWHADPSLQIYQLRGAARASIATAISARGSPALASLGLAFDAWMFHTPARRPGRSGARLPADDDRAQPCRRRRWRSAPMPASARRFSEWRARHPRASAGFPNVYVKLGGLGMTADRLRFFENDEPPSSEELAEAWRPYIETCIEAFGPQRSMFESNFPVDKGMCSYPVLWNAFKRIAADYSADEKTALFSGAAKKAYRLEV